jgi:hypothetical protein
VLVDVSAEPRATAAYSESVAATYASSIVRSRSTPSITGAHKSVIKSLECGPLHGWGGWMNGWLGRWVGGRMGGLGGWAQGRDQVSLVRAD